MTSTLSVFIDESGTTNLQDNQDPTRYYVSTAVIVKTEDVPLVVKKNSMKSPHHSTVEQNSKMRKSGMTKGVLNY